MAVHSIRKTQSPPGIFAQSGSGKSYALGRIIEELWFKLYPIANERKRYHIILLDPNGDFKEFSNMESESNILEKLDKIFKGLPKFVPNKSWRSWVNVRRRKWENVGNCKIDNIFPSSKDPFLTWKWVNLSNLNDNNKKAKAAKCDSQIEHKLFHEDGPITFIVIDEAHNIIPMDRNYGRHIIKCHRIINKIATGR